VEVHALRKRGWSISAIARHTGRDRKTVRTYLSGERTPGVRARPSAVGCAAASAHTCRSGERSSAIATGPTSCGCSLTIASQTSAGITWCGAFVLDMNGIDALSGTRNPPRKPPAGASCGPGSPNPPNRASPAPCRPPPANPTSSPRYGNNFTGTVNLRSCGRSANHISLIRYTRPGESRRLTGENRARIAQVDSALPCEHEKAGLLRPELLASDTSSIEGGPPPSAEPHGWGISMSVSGEFQ